MTEEIRSIRYGFHGADLFHRWDGMDTAGIDEAASIQAYADRLTAELEATWPGAEVEVVYDTNADGALPHSLKCRVNDEEDHLAVHEIEYIASESYHSYRWVRFETWPALMRWIGRGLVARYGHEDDDYLATVGPNDDGYHLACHHGEMPPFATHNYRDVGELEAHMRDIQPDPQAWHPH